MSIFLAILSLAEQIPSSSVGLRKAPEEEGSTASLGFRGWGDGAMTSDSHIRGPSLDELYTMSYTCMHRIAVFKNIFKRKWL